VATTDAREILIRKRHEARRRRVLLSLVAGAALTLVLAITQGSGFWLAVTIGFDVAVGGYIALLQHAQQNVRPNAPVVPLHLVEEDPHGASVRVVAG
jgi:predicted nicotinamide N-methyase